MSSYTIQNVKDDLAGRLHGTTVKKITNINFVFRRAAGNLLGKIDPEETRRIKPITLYDKVTDYAAEDDLKENRIIDIRPQEDRNSDDNMSQHLSKEFDLRKKRVDSWVTVMNDGGIKYLRIKKSFTPGALQLDRLDDVTGWAATASAQSLALDEIIYPKGALKFSLAALGSSGYIESSSIDQVDLTDFDEQSGAFLEFYIPNATALAAITSITLRWGNSSTVYWSKQVTTAHRGALRVGRNLLRFDWDSATETGTVDPATIDYSRITVAYNGTAISGIRVSDLFFSIGRIHDIEYYSKYLFNNGGTWADTVSNDDTTINLDTASFNLYLDEVAYEAFGQLQGSDAAADRAAVDKKLNGDSASEGGYHAYKSKNPNQTIKPQGKSFTVKSFRKK